MFYGIREICDVVLRRKSAGYFGNLYLDKDAPVMYFKTLKTSSLESGTQTVYAQGGKGNPRLVAWEGDKTMTFNMEDALISPESFSILSGAGFMDAKTEKPIYVHTTEQIEVDKEGKIKLAKTPTKKGELYIMLMNEDGDIDVNKQPMEIPKASVAQEIELATAFAAWETAYNADKDHVDHKVSVTAPVLDTDYHKASDDEIGSIVFVDYYVEMTSKVKQINIEAAKFGGSYYLEADTLFRSQSDGADYPAEFIIPNCKVQSNFTFTMSNSGDPSTFSFVLDAFPGYTKFDKTRKVLAALQIIEDPSFAHKED